MIENGVKNIQDSSFLVNIYYVVVHIQLCINGYMIIYPGVTFINYDLILLIL